MTWFKKKEQEPAPCPSDILAAMVAIRMVAEPERFIIKGCLRTEYGTRMRSGTWIDADNDIKLVLVTHEKEGWVSPMYAGIDEFSKGGVSLAITSKGRLELMRAGAKCKELNDSLEDGKRRYAGDMAACDAISGMLKLSS